MPATVRYHVLITLLLNELQSLHRHTAWEMAELEDRLAALETHRSE